MKRFIATRYFLVYFIVLTLLGFDAFCASSGGIFSDYKRALKVNPGEVEQLTLNEYSEIPDGVFKFKNLKKLTIRNGLKTLSNKLSKLNRLESLILIDNPIEELPNEIKNCTSIQEIKIINSHLKSLPEGIFEMPNLITMTIKNGRLQSLPNLTKENYVLKSLNLKNNNIEFLNNGLEFLESLESLYCSGNPIKSFTGNTEKQKPFKSLKTLVMRDCGIEHIPYLICPTLQYLDVSSNKITDIEDDELPYMNNLLFIGLENNPITYINEKLFNLSKLKSIQIDKYESLSIELAEISNVCVTYIAVNMGIIDKKYKPCGQRKGMISVYFSEPGKRKK